MESSSFWIILTGALAASSCGLLGAFLVLRKMALIGDAISHAVLPGIAIAFLLSGSRSVLPMFIGASIFGLVTAILIEMLHKKWHVQEDASIGIVFTTLFAIGVVLITAFTGHIDLDQECVLYGEIAYTPWDILIVSGTELGPRPVWILGFVFLLDLLLVLLLYKELVIASFDAAMATSIGLSATLIHYILMGAVSMTTVAAFESVGAILVVAMLIVPGATAYMLTERLKVMLFLTVLVGTISSIVGYWLAGIWDSSIAGAMTIAAGAQFMLAFIFSPKYGLLGKFYNQFISGIQYAADHMLLELSRKDEKDKRPIMTRRDLFDSASTTTLKAHLAFLRNNRSGLMKHSNGDFSLTVKGQQQARKLLQGHRLWETYLSDKVGLPQDHTHDAAHLMEHYIDDRLQKKIKEDISGRK